MMGKLHLKFDVIQTTFHTSVKRRKNNFQFPIILLQFLSLFLLISNFDNVFLKDTFPVNNGSRI